MTLDAAGAAKTVEAEAVLIAVGRNPLSLDLGLEKVGIEVDRGGFIKVDDSFRTTCPSVYAIGDVIRPPLLAHKASAEGVAAVEIMAGVREPGFDLLSIAGCIYCEPEVAIGRTERGAGARARHRGQGRQVSISRDRQGGRGQSDRRLRQDRREQGIRRSDGCQIIGHHATDLISEIVLGRTLETTTAELGQAPSASDAVGGDHGGGARSRGRGDPHLARA